MSSPFLADVIHVTLPLERKQLVVADMHFGRIKGRKLRKKPRANIVVFLIMAGRKNSRAIERERKTKIISNQLGQRVV
jgi:hypothetical protein